PEGERLVGLDDPPAQDEVEGAAEPDDPRQALRPTVDQRDAEAPLGEAQPGALGRDPQVAPQRQLEAARQAPPLDRRDSRLRGDPTRESERAAGVVETRGERLDRL